MATTKKTAKKTAPAKSATKTTPKQAAPATKPSKAAANAGFVAPDWGCVIPGAVVAPPSGDAEIDAALARLLADENSEDIRAIAERAPIETLIAAFTGPALESGVAFHDEELASALSPADKRKRNKVYWAADAACLRREALHGWFAKRLATTPAGRERLLDIAASDGDRIHDARCRAQCAIALGPHAVEMASALAARLDPTRWIGETTIATSTYLMHAYTVGALAALHVDVTAAIARFAPLFVPSNDLQADQQFSAVAWAIKAAVDQHGFAPERLAGFTPYLLQMLGHMALGFNAMFTLEVLPHDPAVTTAVAARLGKTLADVAYWDDVSVRLLARSNDPEYIPWLAAALAANWMHWPAVFEGLGNIGDPAGIPIIENWLAKNSAPDRQAAAAPILAALRAKA